ncbi:MAG: serine hydrolase [Chitinophagales bacterium]
MIEQITYTINKIDKLIQEQLPESKYQFELHDLITNTKHFRGYDEPFHWGSVYKLFVVAEIIKMSEEGLLNLDDELVLHKERYKHGNGIMKFMTHLNKLTYIDACKMVMATSDNLCADELLNVVGFDRLNNLFEKSDCKSSKLSQNLDTVVMFLFDGINSNINSTFFQSKNYFEYFENKLQELLKINYTSASNINTCFKFIFNDYLSGNGRKIFKECLLLSNQHSRIAYYSPFSSFLLKGKTGTLGIGIANNENIAIIHKETKEVYGYFAINTKDNKKRYFQSNDTIGLIGLEIANLYEQLYQQTK